MMLKVKAAKFRRANSAVANTNSPFCSQTCGRQNKCEHIVEFVYPYTEFLFAN